MMEFHCRLSCSHCHYYTIDPLLPSLKEIPILYEPFSIPYLELC